MPDNKDIFAEFGGKSIKNDDPFAEFGGKSIKKKADTNVSQNTSQPYVGGGETGQSFLQSGEQQPEVPSFLTEKGATEFSKQQQAEKDRIAQLAHPKGLESAIGAYSGDKKVIDKAIEIGANNAGTISQGKDKGILDSINQSLYIPALNKGFSDLIIKPLAGATDFVDRTIDKTYTTLTGEQTPSWLRKGGAFDKAINFYEKEYEGRDLPKNLISETAEGVVGTLPLVAAMATGSGEANTLAKAPEVISNLTKLFATQGALNSYKDATDANKGYLESLGEAGKGFMKGGEEGLKLEAMMLVGGALGNGVVNKLAEKGLLKGGKAAESILHALGISFVFGGTSVGDDLLAGRDINYREAAKQAGMGLAFELPKVVSGVSTELKEQKFNNDIDNQIVKNAALSKAASNINSEGAIRTLMGLSPEQIKDIKDNIKKSKDDLYAESIETGAKAYDEQNQNQKRSLYIDQLALKTQGDIKLIEDKLRENKKEISDTITESDELSPEIKEDLLNKIEILSKQEKNEKSEKQVREEPTGQENGQKNETERIIQEGENARPEEVQNKVDSVAEKIASGETLDKPEDIKFYEDNKKEIDDAIKIREQQKSDQQQYQGVAEQQQGEQKNREYQEEPIPTTETKAGGGNSPVEGKKIKIESNEPALITKEPSKAAQPVVEQPIETKTIGEKNIEPIEGKEIKRKTIDKFDKAFKYLDDIKNTKAASIKRSLAEERRSFLEKNPSIKYIDDNISKIYKQLEDKNLIIKKGDCP